MTVNPENDLACQACVLLGDSWQLDKVTIKPLTPDGSMRLFCRLQHENGQQVIAIAPPAASAHDIAEAAAGWHIGRHLFACQVPVPEPLAFDCRSGVLVCEYLGHVRLHDLITARGLTSEVVELYRQAVVELANMQLSGRENFDTSWCWDTPRYDQQLMVERESGYFLRALCGDLLGVEFSKKIIAAECAELARLAAEADASFFLHRDFQSRNIMVCNGSVRFIDYQAGRLGPLGYDLSSLLIDPYAALPGKLQDELFGLYVQTLGLRLGCSQEVFLENYLLLALQRNLQILGAFAFLSHQRQKPFFRKYLQPALVSAHHLLGRIDPPGFPALNRLVLDCQRALVA